MSKSIDINGIKYNVGNNVLIGSNITLCNNITIGNNVVIGNNVYIDNNCIIRDNVEIGDNSIIGANCILGEYLQDFYLKRKNNFHPLKIGKNAVLRSGTIIYGECEIGSDFQTGHNVTIREYSTIKNHVSIGTLSDIQGKCIIGNYSRLHSNVHIGQLSKIDDFVWIFPYVVLTNDPTPPSDNFIGVHVNSFAVIATAAVILPGIEIEGDSLIGAGTIVNKNVDKYSVVVGNPAKKISDVRNIKNKITGENVYPWREHFSKNMPWQSNGFEKWYESLDINSKNEINI